MAERASPLPIPHLARLRSIRRIIIAAVLLIPCGESLIAQESVGLPSLADASEQASLRYLSEDPAPAVGGLSDEDTVAVGLPATANSEPFYNLLSSPEEPNGGLPIRVKSSSSEIELMVYGRIALDTVFSNGRLLAPYDYIFLGPGTPESQWTNAISARQSTLGFLFTGPNLGSFKSMARFETYFLSSVTDANVNGLAQYFLYAKLINDDWALTGGVTSTLVNPRAPSVLNASAGSDFGNLGFMRPQLRVERFLSPAENVRITPQLALASPVGTDFFQTPTTGPSGIQMGERRS